MFRKIHSNRDPRDTLGSEIHREFKPYFEKAGSGIRSCAKRSPKFLFGVMVLSILVSICLSLTVFRYKPVKKKQMVVSPISDGYNKIMALGSAIKQTIAIKKQVDSLLAKKILSKEDSLTLETDLDQLQKLKP
jgi:hypothetical protein